MARRVVELRLSATLGPAQVLSLAARSSGLCCRRPSRWWKLEVMPLAHGTARSQSRRPAPDPRPGPAGPGPPKSPRWPRLAGPALAQVPEVRFRPRVTGPGHCQPECATVRARAIASSSPSAYTSKLRATIRVHWSQLGTSESATQTHTVAVSRTPGRPLSARPCHEARRGLIHPPSLRRT